MVLSIISSVIGFIYSIFTLFVISFKDTLLRLVLNLESRIYNLKRQDFRAKKPETQKKERQNKPGFTFLFATFVALRETPLGFESIHASLV
jgi:hypothetical protein